MFKRKPIGNPLSLGFPCFQTNIYLESPDLTLKQIVGHDPKSWGHGPILKGSEGDSRNFGDSIRTLGMKFELIFWCTFVHFRDGGTWEDVICLRDPLEPGSLFEMG